MFGGFEVHNTIRMQYFEEFFFLSYSNHSTISIHKNAYCEKFLNNEVLLKVLKK